MNRSERGLFLPRISRLWLEVLADLEEVGQRQRRAVIGLVEGLPGLVTVQWLGALAAVVVEDPVLDLVVDLPDQVLSLVEAVGDQAGDVVALLLAEPVHAVLALRRDVLLGGVAAAGGLDLGCHVVGHGTCDPSGT